MPRQSALPPSLAPRMVSREIVAAYTGVSANTFDKMVETGVMPKARTIPGTTRKAWDLREVDIAIDALPRDGEELAPADEGWS
ncbi:hypothetical protein SAMN05444170_1512 [Bradyrhizobium erythrophlei]|uniref:Transcriptional regulator, AlpA family n=1 Tax=Bradyrhizobium erythrophlei TaxID=1437360 RepID=A0A1M7TEK3_9BRAD|nr:hypothetical protein SAMN05444170_1512 [Bradyrhizobium erythrophlei]